ncbi:hypothetical protein [Mycoplasma sp. Ms02]|uniref:hypothetical protein n=1 Tax=Mycoplasma sp. Ms02 TaxID=353851 RepID=UPI001C8AF76E|nr:hypothetical protein [Mycoplasma sp. Ms02]QZE12577.1 hypothetical protein K4L35_01155 [Mycoplasma sp. Ms02]
MSSKTNKVLKGSLITAGITFPISIGLGTFAYLLSQDLHVKNQDSVYKVFSESEINFKIYKDYLDLNNQDVQELQNAFDAVKHDQKLNVDDYQSDSEEQVSLKEQLAKMEDAQSLFLDKVIEKLDSIKFNNKEREKEFWVYFLDNQLDRIREKDLKNQLLSMPDVWIEKFKEEANELSSEQKANFLNAFKKGLNQILEVQNQKINSYLDSIQDAYNFAKENEEKHSNLSQNIVKTIEDLLKTVVQKDLRWNDVQITSALVNSTYLSAKKLLEDSSETIEEIQQLKEKLNLVKEATSTSETIKSQIEELLQKANDDEAIASSKVDFETIKTSLTSFYESLKDETKTDSQIHDQASEISKAVVKLPEELSIVKNEISKLASLISTLSGDDLRQKSKELQSNFQKAMLLSDAYKDLKNELTEAQDSRIVNASEKAVVESRVESLLSVDQDLDSKLNQALELIKKESQELDSKNQTYGDVSIIAFQLRVVKSSAYLRENINGEISSLLSEIDTMFRDSSLPGFALTPIKQSINEKMRSLLKEHLRNLIEDLKYQNNRLSQQSLDQNESVLKSSEELIKEIQNDVEENNPIPSVELFRNFGKVEDKIRNVKIAAQVTEANKQSLFASDFLETVFSDGNPEYQFSENELARIEEYKNKNVRLAELRKAADEGDSSQETLDEINSITAGLQNMVNTGEAFKNLSNTDKKSSDLLDKAKSHKAADILAPQIEALEVERAKVKALFSTPNASLIEVAKANEQLEAKRKELEKAMLKLDLEDKLRELRKKKDETFANPNSPAAQALQAQIDKLQTQIDTEEITPEFVSKVDKEIDSLYALVEPLNELEKAQAASNSTKSSVESSKFVGDRTNQAFAKNDELQSQASAMIESLKNGNIPNLLGVDTLKNQIENNEENIKASFLKDKIQKLNDSAQATKSNNDSKPASNNRDDLASLDREVNSALTETDLDKLGVFAEKMEKEAELANELKDIQDIYDALDHQTSELVARYVEDLMNQNEINPSDSAEEAQAKIDALRAAKPLIEEKKNLASKIAELDDILGEEKDWKVHEETKKEVEKLKAEMLEALYNDNLTVEDLKAKRKALEDKMEDLREQKVTENNEYDQKVTAIDALQERLDSSAETLGLDDSSFYAQAKKAYEAAKNDKVLNGTQEIADFERQLEAALNKDKVKAKLAEIDAFLKSSDFGTSPEHDKVKADAERYIAAIQAAINDPSLTPEQVEAMYETAKNQLSMVKLQEQTADKIKELTEAESQGKEVNTQSIQNLRNALEEFKPISPDYLGIPDEGDQKGFYSKLRDVLNQESQIADIRNRIKNNIESTTAGNEGIRKRLKDALDAQQSEVLPEQKAVVDEVLDKMISQINLSESLEDQNGVQGLNAIDNRVNLIANNINEFVDLAKEIKTATDATQIASPGQPGLVNPSAPGVRKLRAALDQKIKEAQNIYSSANDIDAITRIKEELQVMTQRLIMVDDLNTLIKEQSEILRSVSFHRLDPEGSGVAKRRAMQEYLESYDLYAASIAESGDANAIEKLAQVKAKFEAEAKDLVAFQKELSEQITRLLNEGYTGNITDADRLTRLLWSTVPAPLNPPSSSEGLRANESQNDQLSVREARKKQELYTAVNEYRNETNTVLESILDGNTFKSEEILAKNAVNKRVKSLIRRNDKSLDLNEDQNEGELYDLRQQALSYRDFVAVIKELAAQTARYENLNNRVIAPSDDPNNPDPNESPRRIREQKEGASALIQEAKDLINLEEIPANYQDQITQKLEQVSDAYHRLNILFEYSQVYQEFKSTTILVENNTVHEREPIDALITEFWSVYLQPNSDPEEVFETFFKNADEADADKKNKLIKYALENAKKLKNAILVSDSYLLLKDPFLDSAEVTSKFLELQNKKTLAQQALVAKPNVEATKKTLAADLATINQQILTAKRNQINTQLELDLNLKNFLTDDTGNPSRKSSLTTLFGTEDYLTEAFKRDSIDALDALRVSGSATPIETLSFGEVNKYLRQAKSGVIEQVVKVYDSALQKVTEAKDILTSLQEEFGPLNQQAQFGAGIQTSDLSALQALKETMDAVENESYDSEDNYEVKISKLLEVVNSGSSGVVAQTKAKIREQFSKKMSPTADSGQTRGFYPVFVESMDAFIASTPDKNPFDYNGLETLKDLYTSLKSNYESLATDYDSVKNEDEATNLSSFAKRLQDLNDAFVEFEVLLQSRISEATSVNPLVAVFKDLYVGIEYETDSDYTREVKNLYNQHKQSVEEAIAKLPTNLQVEKSQSTLDTYVVKDLDGSSTELIEAIKGSFTKATEHKDWIHQGNILNLLFGQLTSSSNVQIPLPPVSQANSGNVTFGEKFKIAIPVEKLTKEAFLRSITSILPSDSEFLDITDNDTFLQNFKQFSFTTKDFTSEEQEKSIFAQNAFRVRLKKWDSTKWYDEDVQTADVDRKTIRVKLSYQFTSDNSELKSHTIDKQIEITFDTIDRIELPRGLSKIFYTDDNTIAQAARVKVFNAEEAGWHIPSNMSAAQVVSKAYGIYKKIVYGTEQNKAPGSDWNFVRPGSNQGRITVAYDGSDPSTNEKYGFKINSGSSLSVTYNTSVLLDNSKQIARLEAFDGTQEIALYTFTPGQFIGSPIAGTGSIQGQPFTPQHYDNRLKSQLNIYNPQWWAYTNYEDRGAASSVNAYKFAFEYDTNTKDLYIYNSWVENALFLRSATQMERITELKNITNNNRDKSPENVAKYNRIYEEVEALPDKSKLSSELLNKVLWAYSSVHEKVVAYGQGSQFTLVGASNTTTEQFADPIWPISGGQATVRWTRVDWGANGAKSIILTPVGANGDGRDYSETGTVNLKKRAARNSLYSTSIDTFFVKIR